MHGYMRRATCLTHMRYTAGCNAGKHTYCEGNSDANSSTARNAFARALKTAPKHVCDAWQDLLKQPTRNGKNSLKAQWREAFLETKSWDGAFFQRFDVTEKQTGSSSEALWVSWKELSDSVGEKLATTLHAQGVVESRPWPGVDPKLNVFQYRRTLEKEFASQVHKQVQEVKTEKAELTDAAREAFLQCAQSFGEGGAGDAPRLPVKGGKKGTQNGSGDSNADGSPAGADNGKLAACQTSVRKGLQALEIKVQAARTCAHAVAQLKPEVAKYTDTLKHDLDKHRKKADRPRKMLADIKTALNALDKNTEDDDLFKQAKTALGLSGKVIQDRASRRKQAASWQQGAYIHKSAGSKAARQQGSKQQVHKAAIHKASNT